MKLAHEGVPNEVLLLLGRTLFTLIFFIAAPMHTLPETIAFASSQGVPMASIVVPVAGAMALAGGLSILLGLRAKVGAWLIVLYLAPVTFIAHQFWLAQDPSTAEIQFTMFLENLSIVGGALLISQFGTGPLSLDAVRP